MTTEPVKLDYQKLYRMEIDLRVVYELFIIHHPELSITQRLKDHADYIYSQASKTKPE